MSRYGISTTDVVRAAQNLQIGEGLSDRIQSVDAGIFIDEGEDWVDDAVSDFLGVPLKAIPALGDPDVPASPTTRNFPFDFIKAATYWALSRLLNSEYFENSPNASQSGEWAELKAQQHLMDFRSRSTTRVGAGRRRNPNPFVPPNIAPKEPPVGQQPVGQGH